MKFSWKTVRTLPQRMPATASGICESIGIGIGFALLGVLWLFDMLPGFPLNIGVIIGCRFLAAPLLIKWDRLAGDDQNVPHN